MFADYLPWILIAAVVIVAYVHRQGGVKLPGGAKLDVPDSDVKRLFALAHQAAEAEAKRNVMAGMAADAAVNAVERFSAPFAAPAVPADPPKIEAPAA